MSMKTFFLFVAFLIFTSCHNGNTNVSTGNNTIIYDFPVTQIAESEKIDLEIIGINDLMVIDTLLFAFKASGIMIFSKCIRLTIGNIWENSFLRAEALMSFYLCNFPRIIFLKMTIWSYGSRMVLYKNGHY